MQTQTLKDSITAAPTFEAYQQVEKQIDAHKQAPRQEIRVLRNALIMKWTDLLARLRAATEVQS